MAKESKVPATMKSMKDILGLAKEKAKVFCTGRKMNATRVTFKKGSSMDTANGSLSTVCKNMKGFSKMAKSRESESSRKKTSSTTKACLARIGPTEEASISQATLKYFPAARK